MVGPDGALWFMDGGTTPAIGRIDPTTHAITEFNIGLKPAVGLGRVAVGPDGNLWFGDKGTTPSDLHDESDHARDHHVHHRSERGQPSGRDLVGSDGNVWLTDQGATTIRAIVQIGAAPRPRRSHRRPSAGAGQFGTAQQCLGDLWSSWAGEQPSLTAYGFDGYQWRLDGNPIAGPTGAAYMPNAADIGRRRRVRQPGRTCDRVAVPPPLVAVEAVRGARRLLAGPTRPEIAQALLGRAELAGAGHGRRCDRRGWGADADPHDRRDGGALVGEPDVAVRARPDPAQKAARVQTGW